MPPLPPSTLDISRAERGSALPGGYKSGWLVRLIWLSPASVKTRQGATPRGGARVANPWGPHCESVRLLYLHCGVTSHNTLFRRPK